MLPPFYICTHRASPLGEGDRVSGGRGFYSHKRYCFSWDVEDAVPYKYRDFVPAIIIVFHSRSKIYSLCAHRHTSLAVASSLAKPTSFAEGKHHAKKLICPKRQISFFVGAPSESRTPDTLIKSQVLYHLS